jgi:hypothetical protein
VLLARLALQSAVTPSFETLDGILTRASELQSAQQEASSTPAKKDVIFQRGKTL